MQLISRQEAIKKNLNKYFTGQPCIHGHVSERYVKKHGCIECKSIQKKRQRERQKQERVDKYGKNEQTRYFTGEACPKGHVAERLIANGHCVECKKEQYEGQRRAKGMLPKDEANQLRRDATKKRKKENQQKYQESLLNTKEKEIVNYARQCIQQMYRKTSAYNDSYLLPTVVIEQENGYSSEELNDYLYSLRPSWRTKRKWHVDHIIPLSKLVKKGVTELYILNSLDNIQLLTPAANLKKSAKLIMSENKVNEFIADKLCSQPLGLYKPKERIRTLVNLEAEIIYRVITSSISGTNFRVKASKHVAINAIIEDMWNRRDFFSIQNSYSEKEIYDEFRRYGGYLKKEGIMYLLYKGYKPLKKIIKECKKCSDFKYRVDAQQYFRPLIEYGDAVASVYYMEQIILSSSLKEKGFIRSFFT